MNYSKSSEAKFILVNLANPKTLLCICSTHTFILLFSSKKGREGSKTILSIGINTTAKLSVPIK